MEILRSHKLDRKGKEGNYKPDNEGQKEFAVVAPVGENVSSKIYEAVNSEVSCNRKLQNSDVMTNLSSKSNPLSDNEQTVESIPMNGPGLQAHNSEKQFKLSVDVSDTGARAVLWQKHDNGFDPVCYFYKKFTKHQKNYSSVEKEALAMVMALQYFKIYVKNTKVPVIVYTEHNPLQFIAKMKDKNEKILRWTLVLQLYNIKIVPISGKSKLIPDALYR